MNRHTLLPRFCAAALVLMLAPAALLAATTAKAMYESALAREQAVRARMADDDASAAVVLKEIRSVENAYLGVVRRHPTSSYSDNALWNAGRLALDAFARFGQTSDRETGLHLLGLLAAQYPSSKLAKRAPEVIAAAPPPRTAAPANAAVATGAQASHRLSSGPARQPAAPSAAQSGLRAAAGTSDQVARGRLNSGASGAGADPQSTMVGTALQGGPARATIKSVTRTVLPDVVRVTIEMDAEMPFHEERLDNPPRVFLDFQSTRAAASLVDKTLRFDGDADVVRQIRIGRHPNATIRVVLDAAGITGYSVYPLYDPYRLVIDCARLSPSRPPAVVPAVAIGGMTAPTAAPASASTIVRTPPRTVPLFKTIIASRLPVNWIRSMPSVTPRATMEIRAARAETVAADTTTPTPAAPLAPPALLPPPARNSSGGFSIARQLGLGVSRIVIDPGHGGHDPGAKGKGITEAELVLDIALRLEKLLQHQGGVEVVLTRRTDEFIPLQERTAIANREGADLFLSIHANASENPQARGIETYFLNFANNLSAAAVAARENAASGQAMAALPDFVKAIALNNKLDESRDFAAEVQRTMIERVRGANKTVKNLGVKQAPFVVLIGAAMPSVLAEISFITNPQEAKLLRANNYRQRIAEALLTAIRKYQSSLHTVATVAHQ